MARKQQLYVVSGTENGRSAYLTSSAVVAHELAHGEELSEALRNGLRRETLAAGCAVYLVDDRRSAVALPEVPYLGVLPGTGGLTRVVDKRMVRRDYADIFSTLAEGIKGKRAVKWRLVDGVFPSSQFVEKVAERAETVAAGGRPGRYS